MAENIGTEVQVYLAFSSRSGNDEKIIMMEMELDDAANLKPDVVSMASDQGLVVKPVAPGEIKVAHLVRS